MKHDSLTVAASRVSLHLRSAGKTETDLAKN